RPRGCPAGQYCDGAQTCQEMPAGRYACSSLADCGADEVCASGLCAKPPLANQTAICPSGSYYDWGTRRCELGCKSPADCSFEQQDCRTVAGTFCVDHQCRAMWFDSQRLENPDGGGALARYRFNPAQPGDCTGTYVKSLRDICRDGVYGRYQGPDQCEMEQ